MVKTAEELKEYQRLYYQQNKQKIDERRKIYLPKWRHNNEDYKSYHREYYKKNKYKMLEQIKVNVKSKPNYYKEYNIKNKHRIRKSLSKVEREKNQGLAMGRPAGPNGNNDGTLHQIPEEGMENINTPFN